MHTIATQAGTATMSLHAEALEPLEVPSELEFGLGVVTGLLVAGGVVAIVIT
jgi:hypothetical protein